MAKPTIVTMYFNLKELPDSSKETRPIEFYLQNGRGTLQLEYPMVLFCDSVTKPLLQALRDELVDPEQYPTVYIERNLSDYDFYKQCWPVITENRKKSRYYKNPGDRNTVSYLLVCMFKIVAIQMASQRNDYGSYHYFWMDFGCSHVAKKNMKEASIKMLNNPNPKISVLYINYRSKKTLEDMDYAVNTGMCGMAGTVFSAQKDYIIPFCSYMWSTFYEMLANGVGHTDEQVFTYCYDRHPELFTIYFGDYYSVILNYHHTVQDWHTVKYCFIQHAKSAGRHDLASLAAKSLLAGYEKKTSDLPESEVAYMRSIVNL
jgi:hypothetical protein